MKATFLLSSLKLSGGVNVVFELANGLLSRGHEITLATPKSLHHDTAALNPKIKILQGSVIPGKSNDLFRNLKVITELNRLLPPADILIATHTPTTVFTKIDGKNLYKGKPVWLLMDYPGMFQGQPYNLFLLNHALKWHDKTIAISRYLQEWAKRKHPSADVSLLRIGLSGQDVLVPIPEDQRITQNTTYPTLFYLGDDRPRKGLRDFLAAANLVKEKFPNLHLWIASKDLLEIQTALPYTFIHRPATTELAKLYATCDVFVSASWWEGFGLPPLEAMACGAPVVTTESGGVDEFVKPNINAVVAKPKDPPSLAQAIFEILNSPDLSRRLRSEGPKTAAEYNWNDAVSFFEAQLLRLL